MTDIFEPLNPMNVSASIRLKPAISDDIIKKDEKTSEQILITVGIIDEANKKGYTASVTSLTEIAGGETFDLKNRKQIFKYITEHPDGIIRIIGAADFGLQFFEEIQKKFVKNIFEFVLASDKFYKFDNFPNICPLTIIAPKFAIDEYQKQYAKAKFKGIATDLVASTTKEKMEEFAARFKKNNQNIVETLSGLKSDGTYFIGGRVQLEDSSWKPNTQEIFQKTAHDLLEQSKGGDIVCCLHGLRSFTKPDGTNDFSCVEAMYEIIGKGLLPGQKACFATKELLEEKRVSTFLIIEKDVEGKVIRRSTHVNDAAADFYYHLLSDAAAKNKPVYPTAEQMNFLPEFLKLGGNHTQINPIKWELTAPSNIATYNKVMLSLKHRLPIMDANAAFEREILGRTKPQRGFSLGIL